MQNLQPFIDSLQKFAQKRLDFRDPPKLFLKQDQENAKDVFGKTAYYDPNEKSITLFTTGRHPKDILRSFAHELVHHCQNLRGDLSPEKCGPMGTDYAQKNDHMREMEREAYEKGNLCFRDWEDGIKVAMQQENNQLKENKQMVKISKKELKGLIGKILEARLEKEQVTEDAEELDEDGCTSGPHKRDTDEKLEEEKGKECCPKGTPNCPGPGIPGKPAPHNKLSENEELEEGEKMPDKNNDGIPDFAQDGKGANDLGKAKGADSADEKEKKGDDKKEKSEKDLSNVPPQLRDSVAKKMKESKIQTPEQEKALYESRFNKRNEEIFDKLKKLWTK